MSYIDRVLEPGEKVRYHTEPSWTLYVPGLLIAILAIAFFVTGGAFLHSAVLFWPIGIVIALAALWFLGRAWFERYTTEIVVTDRRVILVRGFIRRQTIEMNMSKVESVDVNQTLLGRIFDYGDVTVRGTGATLETLRRVDKPLALRTSVSSSGA